jgi:hypothetical protein
LRDKSKDVQEYALCIVLTNIPFDKQAEKEASKERKQKQQHLVTKTWIFNYDIHFLDFLMFRFNFIGDSSSGSSCTELVSDNSTKL